MGWNKVAIVGVGLIKFGELFDKGIEQMVGEAYASCIKSVDKGFDPHDIDAGFFSYAAPRLVGVVFPGGVVLANVVGLAGEGKPFVRIENGCPTGTDAFRVGCLAVASGVHDTILVCGAEKMKEFPADESLLTLAGLGHPTYTGGITAPAPHIHRLSLT